MRSATSITLATKKPDENTDDPAALFRSAVGDAKPLTHDRIPPPRPTIRPIPRHTEPDEKPSRADKLSDHIPWDEAETGDELAFMRPGLARDALRRLRRGHWPVQDQLDLHGLTRDQARAYLVEFLDACKQRGLRCIRIVHGKGLGSPQGEPVLKQKVKHWLMQRDEVLAFTQARPAEGGGGAVVVLLKSDAGRK
jgi:DNA-nicking Smr family endonuclease